MAQQVIKLSADGLLDQAGEWFSGLAAPVRHGLTGAGLGAGALTLRRLLSKRDKDHKNKGIMRQALLGALLGGTAGASIPLALPGLFAKESAANWDEFTKAKSNQSATPQETETKPPDDGPRVNQEPANQKGIGIGGHAYNNAFGLGGGMFGVGQGVKLNSRLNKNLRNSIADTADTIIPAYERTLRKSRLDKGVRKRVRTALGQSQNDLLRQSRRNRPVPRTLWGAARLLGTAGAGYLMGNAIDRQLPNVEPPKGPTVVQQSAKHLADIWGNK